MLIPVTNEVLKACHSQHVVLCERQKLPIYDTLPWPKEKTKPKIHNNRVSLMSSQDNTRDTKPVSPIRLGTISTPIKHWLFNCRLTRPAAYPPHPPGTTNRGNNLLPICKYLRDYSRVPYGTSARLDPPRRRGTTEKSETKYTPSKSPSYPGIRTASTSLRTRPVKV